MGCRTWWQGAELAVRVAIGVAGATRADCTTGKPKTSEKRLCSKTFLSENSLVGFKGKSSRRTIRNKGLRATKAACKRSSIPLSELSINCYIMPEGWFSDGFEGNGKRPFLGGLMSDRRGKIKVMETIAAQNTRRIRLDVFNLLRGMRSDVNAGRLRGIPFEGELPGDFAQRCRKMNPRFWDFWQFLCDSIRESMQSELRVMEAMFPPAPPSSEYRLYFSQAQVRYPSTEPNWATPQAAISDAARDPPSPFTPIPNKIELGGCARSDSLVRSLVF